MTTDLEGIGLCSGSLDMLAVVEGKHFSGPQPEADGVLGPAWEGHRYMLPFSS